MQLIMQAIAHADHAGSYACQENSSKREDDARIRHRA
jgi:hypothetical protein